MSRQGENVHAGYRMGIRTHRQTPESIDRFLPFRSSRLDDPLSMHPALKRCINN
jgi:hypothetical protein